MLLGWYECEWGVINPCVRDASIIIMLNYVEFFVFC